MSSAPERVEGGPDRRKLVAVVHADIVGYSRLIGLDDTGTLERLRALRRNLIDPAIAEHGGRIVNIAGDALLVVFDSVDGAVRCAMKIQQQMPLHDGDQSHDSRIRFRIGINVGDVIVDGSDVHGDGVNVAARLQAECSPGAVCVSRAVHEHIRGRLDLAFETRGPLNFKNIAHPVDVFVWRPDAATGDKSIERTLVHGTGEALPLPDKPSIAVLAFTNMSGDAEQEYFSDGIADDIITELSRSHSLFVIARNSSFTYKSRAADIKQIARELGVRYVLEGSVRRSGGRVRIVAQLVDAEAGKHIWAERYDRALEDVFAVQDEITNAVAYAIEPAISHAERQRAIRKAPENLNAWEAYQRGLWHMAKRTQVEMERAQHFFRRAIELDPLFATPHAMLAFIYDNTQGLLGASRMNQDQAKAEARKAIELDPDDASALAVMAWIPVAYADYETALQMADHAISINPNNFGAYVARAHALAFGGRPAEAEEPLLTALRLSPRDPLRSLALAGLTCSYYLSGNYAEAAKVGQSVVRDFPDFFRPYRWLAASLGQLNRTNEAREALHQAMTISPESFELIVRQRQPWQRLEDYEHMLDGLRKAGWQG